VKGWCSKKYEGVYAGEGGGKFTITLKDDVLCTQLTFNGNSKGNHQFLMENNAAEFIFNPETDYLSFVQIDIANTYT
jgi:hypothetical protein